MTVETPYVDEGARSSRRARALTRTHIRATPCFFFLRHEQVLELSKAIEALLGDGCELVVVRAKDRLNNPTSFGYMVRD